MNLGIGPYKKNKYCKHVKEANDRPDRQPDDQQETRKLIDYHTNRVCDGPWTKIENGATYKVTISSEATYHIFILIEGSRIKPKHCIKIDKLQR